MKTHHLPSGLAQSVKDDINKMRKNANRILIYADALEMTLDGKFNNIETLSDWMREKEKQKGVELSPEHQIRMIHIADQMQASLKEEIEKKRKKGNNGEKEA